MNHIRFVYLLYILKSFITTNNQDSWKIRCLFHYKIVKVFKLDEEGWP